MSNLIYDLKKKMVKTIPVSGNGSIEEKKFNEVELVARMTTTARPPKVRSVSLPFKRPIYFFDEESSEDADTSILAYCKDVNEYAKVTHGDWIYRWYQITCQPIKVEKGKWEKAEPVFGGGTDLTFICYDTWPTPESKIDIKKLRFPYRKGRIINFWLDTSERPPLIIAQQERSPIPPHNTMNKPRWNFKDPNSKQLYDKVVEAVTKFYRNSDINPQGFDSVKMFL